MWVFTDVVEQFIAAIAGLGELAFISQGKLPLISLFLPLLPFFQGYTFQHIHVT